MSAYQILMSIIASDKEKLKKLLIAISMGVAIFITIILLPIYLLLHPIETLKMFLSANELEEVKTMQNEHPYILGKNTTEFHGRFPVPIYGVVTSDFGERVHPITGLVKMHQGMDISGVHHDKVIAIEDGIVTKAEIQSGYGNCVEIKHEIVTYTISTDEEGNTVRIKHVEIFYSFYAHLSRIDVVEGMRVLQGEVIGLEGGDPKTDPNHGSSTGHHLHFEIRLRSGGGQVDPKDYIGGKPNEDE